MASVARGSRYVDILSRKRTHVVDRYADVDAYVEEVRAEASDGSTIVVFNWSVSEFLQKMQGDGKLYGDTREGFIARYRADMLTSAAREYAMRRVSKPDTKFAVKWVLETTKPSTEDVTELVSGFEGTYDFLRFGHVKAIRAHYYRLLKFYFVAYALMLGVTAWMMADGLK